MRLVVKSGGNDFLGRYEEQYMNHSMAALASRRDAGFLLDAVRRNRLQILESDFTRTADLLVTSFPGCHLVAA